MQEVQRALRQKNQLIDSFPRGSVGEVWRSRLAQIEVKAEEEEDWIGASTLLKELTTALQSYEKSLSEAQELYSFVESEWKELRNKLDSANIKVNDKMRLSAEKILSECDKSLEEGDIESTLTSLGRADEVIENLRRRI
jgi:NurA-like 5'-3' nuclease